MRILVIDDDEAVLTIVGLMLAGQHELVPASSAAEGLEVLEQSSVDLILLDWMMPGMDGLSLLTRLKADARTNSVPVIFISSKTEPEEVKRAMDAGASDYLKKPFRREELLRRVESIRAAG